MWQYQYTSELYHHGVEGMKWGVRRKFASVKKSAKKTGSKISKKHDTMQLKSANREAKRIKKQGITIDKKSNHRLKLEERYKTKKGMSQEQAQAAANNRIRAEKIVAASAGIYVGSKIVKAAATGAGFAFATRSMGSDFGGMPFDSLLH